MFKIWINVSNPQQKEIVLTVNKINQILTKKYARVINQTVHEISRSILSLFNFEVTLTFQVRCKRRMGSNTSFKYTSEISNSMY